MSILKIEFRGKVVQRIQRFPEVYHDFGWVYGTYEANYNGNFYECIHVIDDEKCETNTYVIKGETLGQYINLTDIDGQKIYVGDILQRADTNGKIYRYKVFEVPGGFGINEHQDDLNKKSIPFYAGTSDMQTASFIQGIKIVGNIHENKELLCKPTAKE